MATDPVCGMFVDERTATLQLTRDNRTYYFCSGACLSTFAAPAGRLRDLRRRLAIAWPASIIVALLTYLPSGTAGAWGAFALATVVQFYPGLEFYRGTWDALRSRMGNMDVLIAVGTTAAYAYSLAVLVAPSRLPGATFFDASALIITLILTGNYLEHLTRDRARHVVRMLRDRLPAEARVVRRGAERQVPVAEVGVGDRLTVRPGERFAADGVVVVGSTTVDESLVTGESLPVAKKPGDPVIAGTVNGEGRVEIDAQHVGEDTFLVQLGGLLSEAETSQVPLQRLADRIAAAFVPGVLALATVASATWYWVGHATLTTALLVFVTVAITACPCAFGIATPAAIVVGTGRAAEDGVLFKGRSSIDKAARVDVVITDKTGTLTAGRPVVTEVVAAPGTTSEDVVAVAAGVESGSTHPLAAAVLDYARAQGVIPRRLTDHRSEPGTGAWASENGHRIGVVRPTVEGDIPTGLPPELDRAARAWHTAGWTWSVVTRDGSAIGALAFRDPPGPRVRDAVRRLQAERIEVVMVTGDNERAARSIAEAVGISVVRWRVPPAGKVAIVREFQREGHAVAFVGDGINDAAALLAADAGIAIGAGTDVATEAGSIVLVRHDFSGVPLALETSRRIVGKVRQNLLWAIGYNAVLLPIAAGALVPLLGFGIYLILPILGALAMAFSSTTVVLNSLSLRRTVATPRSDLPGLRPAPG